MVRVRPSRRNAIIELFKGSTTLGLTRTDVASQLGISYWSARYWMELLVEEKFLRKSVTYTVKGYVRRVTYFLVVPAIYFRTQLAIMFYAEKPRSKTPDPIAEFRVTVVSNRRGMYNLQEFERACIYTGVILAPQTYWIKQQFKITANENDEPIDVDELTYSVPVHKRLDFAERYAVFFRSRRGDEGWRQTHIGWWIVETEPLPMPREGDYEYDERFIKDVEEKKILLGALKVRFNNEKGEMESVEI